MKAKTYSLIGVVISMLSVVAFFIWGWIEGNYKHSWMIYFVPAIAWVILGALSAKAKEEEKKAEEAKTEVMDDKAE